MLAAGDLNRSIKAFERSANIPRPIGQADFAFEAKQFRLPHEFAGRPRHSQSFPDSLECNVVPVPELVETHWYEYLLHNHLATWLKADLMLQEEQRIVVINLPWYLG